MPAQVDVRPWWKRYVKELLTALAVVTLAPVLGVLFVTTIVQSIIVAPTQTPTPLPTIITSTPVPTPLPPTSSPTPNVPTILFDGVAFVWDSPDAIFDNQFSVPGEPTNVKVWVCWAGTARGKDNYERIVKVGPTCALGVNSASWDYNGIALGSDMMQLLGMDTKKYHEPHIVVFSLDGGVPSGWEVVDQ